MTRRVLWVSTSPDTRGGVATVVRTMAATPLRERWRIRHVSTHRDGSVPTRIGAFAAGAVRVLIVLVRDRPAVVHLHTASYGSFARKSVLAWVCHVFRVPVVLQVHGAQFHRFHDRGPRLLQRYIRATLTDAAVVVALGEVWAGRLERIAPRARIVVVPNCVRPARQVEHRTGGPVRVLFLGAVGDRKGTFVLLEAWARLGAAAPEARLTVAGDGEVARARARVTDLALDASVRVLGWVDPGRVPDLLADAHVLVLPSRDEGQPMAVLEAMAHGLCVVATPVGGIPDLIDDRCGVSVPPDDVAALAAALRRVVADGAERARLGAAAADRVRSRFDVDVTWRRVDALYREVCR